MMEELTISKRRIHWQNGLKHLLLILLCVFAIFPIYWMVISSFKGQTEIFNNSLLPSSFSPDNYTYALEHVDILGMTANTFFMAISQAVLQLVTAIMAAYALTRWKFPGSRLIYTLFALTWLVPIQATMIPNYTTLVGMGFRDSIVGVIIPNMASAFAILSLYPAFQSFPKALIEAGMMDKMSAPGVLFKLILPNIKSSIVSLGILLFINSWNEYFWPAMIVSDQGQATLQIGLRSFMSAELTSWGPLMAASVLASLPILVLYLLLQKQVIQSFVKWGIK
jgi:multiple sugar transport system permease protein/sn-glycerol 3-phosphate transport system permease protein